MAKDKEHIVYKLSTGKRVAGVTTILNVINKPALIKWANNLGLRGIDSTTYVDNLADIGTLGHAMIMAHLTDEELDTEGYTEEQVDLAGNSFLSYLNWEKGHTIEPILVETPLVSEMWKYGGTLDLLAKVDRVITLIDFKTGKALYPEHSIQVAAYWILAMEHGHIPNDGLVKEALILRIGRDADEGFEVKLVEDIEANWEVFTHCLAIYELQKLLRRKKK